MVNGTQFLLNLRQFFFTSALSAELQSNTNRPLILWISNEWSRKYLLQIAFLGWKRKHISEKRSYPTTIRRFRFPRLWRRRFFCRRNSRGRRRSRTFRRPSGSWRGWRRRHRTSRERPERRASRRRRCLKDWYWDKKMYLGKYLNSLFVTWNQKCKIFENKSNYKKIKQLTIIVF